MTDEAGRMTRGGRAGGATPGPAGPGPSVGAPSPVGTRGLAEPPRAGGALRRRARAIADHWTFFLVPVVLTGIFWGTGMANSWYGLLRVFYLNTVIAACVGGMVYLFFRLFGDRILERARGGWRAHLAAAAAIAPAVAIGGEAALWLLGRLPGLESVGVTRRGLYTVSAIVVAVVWLVEATVGRLRDRTRQLELREEQARRQALRAQFEALQSRTNPHFLYNALNTVAGLIEEDPRLAERALEKLSDLMRYSLEGARRDRVSLAEEIAAVRDYLEMERLRFGDRLRVTIELAPGTETLGVPPLVLQPLVENAVLHGIAPRVEGGSVRVAAAVRTGVLELEVEDDGTGPGISPHQGTRTALRELRERLTLLYGEQADLTSGPGPSGGFHVRVRIPPIPYPPLGGGSA